MNNKSAIETPEEVVKNLAKICKEQAEKVLSKKDIDYAAEQLLEVDKEAKLRHAIALQDQIIVDYEYLLMNTLADISKTEAKLRMFAVNEQLRNKKEAAAKLRETADIYAKIHERLLKAFCDHHAKINVLIAQKKNLLCTQASS